MEHNEKIDLESMSLEETDKAAADLGLKIKDICDQAAKEVNALLAKFGAGTAKIAISFNGLDPVEVVEPKKRGKKSKTKQS